MKPANLPDRKLFNCLLIGTGPQSQPKGLSLDFYTSFTVTDSGILKVYVGETVAMVMAPGAWSDVGYGKMTPKTQEQIDAENAAAKKAAQDTAPAAGNITAFPSGESPAP